MTTKSRMVNMKVDDELYGLIERARKASGMSRSDWMREALEAGAHRDLRATGRSVEGGPTLTTVGGRQLGRTHVESEKCLHPLPARHPMPGQIVCGVCEAVVRRI